MVIEGLGLDCWHCGDEPRMEDQILGETCFAEAAHELTAALERAAPGRGWLTLTRRVGQEIVITDDRGQRVYLHVHRDPQKDRLVVAVTTPPGWQTLRRELLDREAQP